MTGTITVDDLAAPEISGRGLEILAERAAIPIDCSMRGILQYAQDISDVPVHHDEEFFHSLERFFQEGDQHGQLSAAGKKVLAMQFVNFIVQRSRLEALCLEHPKLPM